MKVRSKEFYRIIDIKDCANFSRNDEKTVFTVADNQIVACFDRQGSITEAFIKQLCEQKPVRAVFCDSGFANDSVKINVEQPFKSLSSHTEIKTI